MTGPTGVGGLVRHSDRLAVTDQEPVQNRLRNASRQGAVKVPPVGH